MQRTIASYTAAVCGPALLLAALFFLAITWGEAVRPGGAPSQARAALYQQTISLSGRVSTAADACAEGNTLDVAPGTPVYYCYVLANNSEITLTAHSLIDSLRGEIWNSQPFTLPAGAVTDTVALGLVISATVQADGDSFATWTATGDGGQSLRANAGTAVNMIEPGIALQKTVGRNADGCAADSSLIVPSGAVVRYCLTVDNTGDAVLTQHAMVDVRLGISHTFDYELPPAQRLVVNQAFLDARGITASLTLSGVTGLVDNTAIFTSTTRAGLTAQDTATATVRVGAASISVLQTVGTQADGCGSLSSLQILSDQQIYFCIQVNNTGNIAVTQHSFHISGIEVGAEFTQPLAPGATFTLTNGVLSSQLGQREMLGPYTFSGFLGTSLIYTVTNEEGYVVTASSSASVDVVTPTPTATRPPSPTATWTPYPTSTWPPTLPPPTDTPAPTPTLAPPTPTDTPTRSYAVSMIATPTPAAISPLAAPQPMAVSPLASPDSAGVTQLGDTGQPTAAVELQSAPAASTPEMPPAAAVAVEPTASSTPPQTPGLPGAQALLITATPTPMPTARPSPTATQRPVVPPPPPPTPDLLLLAATIVDRTLVAVGWLWVLMGGFLLFAAVVLVAALAIRGQERRRFELTPDDAADAHEWQAAADAHEWQAAANAQEWPAAANAQEWPAAANAQEWPAEADATLADAAYSVPPPRRAGDDHWPASLP